MRVAVMVSKFNISFTILCRISRCNFLNLTCCTTRIVMGAREYFRRFFGFENFGPVILLGRLKICPNEHPYLRFYRVPPALGS